MQTVKAIIMAGGQGSRLRPLTCDRPKPMVPVLNVPIMAHIVRLLADAGVREALTTLHLMPEQVTEHFGDGSGWGVELRHLVEDQPMGTAGSVARARAFVDGTVVVISGDALTDLDLAPVLRFHKERGAACTLVLKAVGDPSEYGIVITGRDGRITRFLEKPGRGQVFSDHANTGIYVLEPHVLDRVPEGRPFDFSKELFPMLLQSGEPLFGYVVDAYWSDIGTPEQYRQAHLDALEGKVRLPETWRLPGRWYGPGMWVAEGARIAPAAHLRAPCFVGPGCEIESGAEVGPFTSMGTGCWVGKGASIRHSVLWNGCRVGPLAEVRGAVLADAVTVGRGARIFEGAVIGQRTRVGEGAVVAPDVRVWPEKVVDAHQYVSRPLVWAGTVSRAAVGPRGVRGEAGTELTPELAAGVAGAYAASLPPGRSVVVAHSGERAVRALALAAAAGATSAGVRVRWLDGAAAGEVRVACQHAGGAIYIHEDDPTGVVRLRLWDERGADVPAARARGVDGAFRRDEWRRVGAGGFGSIQPDGELRRGAREAYLTALAEKTRAFASNLARSAARATDRPDPVRDAISDALDPAGPDTTVASCRVAVLVGQGDREREPEAADAERASEGPDEESPGSRLAVLALEACGFRPVRVSGRTPPAVRVAADAVHVAADGAHAPANGMHGPGRLLLWIRVDPAGERLEAWGADGRPVPEAALHVLAVVAADDGQPVRLPVDASDLAERLARETGRRVLWDDGAGPAKDGVELACLAAAAVSALGSLDALLQGLQVPARLQLAVPVEWEQVGQVMRRLADRVGAMAEPPVDGLKVRHDRGWALVRPDPDRPLLRLQVEAATLADARDLLDRYAGYVRSAARPGADPQAAHGGRGQDPGQRDPT